MSDPTNGSRRLLLLSTVGVLYFSEGFPYGIFAELLPLYLRDQGASLTRIGLVTAAGAAWTLKFLWAPLVDRYGSYRRWITGCLLVLIATEAGLGLVSPHRHWFWMLLILLAAASATQDVAIDAYAVARSDSRTVGPINSMRIAAYRAAMIVAGGGLAMVAGRYGWKTTFFLAAAVSAACMVTALRAAPVRGRSTAQPLRDLRAWLQSGTSAAVVLIALLYRFGDSLLSPMIKPFWIDRGYAISEAGTATAGLGMLCTVIGGVVGGLWLVRLGLYRSLLIFGVLQLGSNAGYALAATFGATRIWMYSALVVENLSYGLATAAFLSYFMSACDRRNAATGFALLTAIYGFSRLVAGSMSGVLADHLGYSAFFWLTLAAGGPGLALLGLLRTRIELTQREASETAAAEPAAH